MESYTLFLSNTIHLESHGIFLYFFCVSPAMEPHPLRNRATPQPLKTSLFHISISTSRIAGCFFGCGVPCMIRHIQSINFAMNRNTSKNITCLNILDNQYTS